MTDSGIRARRALTPRYNPRTARRVAMIVAGGLLGGWVLGLAGTYVALVYISGD